MQQNITDSALERVNHVVLNEGNARYGGSIVGVYERGVKAQLMSSRFSRMAVDVVFVLSSCTESFILSFTIHKINIAKKQTNCGL